MIFQAHKKKFSYHAKYFSNKTMDPDRLLKGSQVFCLAPWSHIHVVPTGKVYPCCMSAHLEQNAIGDLRLGDTLESSWNSPKMRDLRKSMLNGQPSACCERCYIPEKNNLSSFRRGINFKMASHFDKVGRTDADGGLDVFRVPYLDIRFSNRCNFRCRTCCPDLSSGWRADAVKLGWIDGSSSSEIRAAEAGGPFMTRIFSLIDDAESVFFAGGEPLLMDEHYQILNRLIARKKWRVRLAYNSNCSVLQYKQYDLLKMWKRFKDILILASLDGSHKRGDYIRKGQDWAAIEGNIAAIRKKCPQALLRLAPTVSVFNAFHLTGFFQELIDKRLFKMYEINVNILFEPAIYNIRNFPPRLKEKLTRQYEDFINEYLPSGRSAETAREHFQAVIRYMNGGILQCLGEFRQVTRQLDELRNENFCEVFPEIRELLDEADG